MKSMTEWVGKKLRKMTTEEKVGQMMGIAYKPRYYHRQDPDFQRLEKLVGEYRIGGAMFYPGDPYEIARSIERLQAKAKTPLLIMADIEWGLPQRVSQSTHFLQNMAVGATGSEDFAYEMGKITAKEARALGIQVGYAPVMDVNSNPGNIIINTRAYGEDPKLVARLGTAFIHGMQQNGLYATAKHFPGHGDTDVDSHMHLPAIKASKTRLEQVELPPFQAAIDAGVKCVMIGHITFSEIPEMQGRPATLDPYFSRSILRDILSFNGLVLTDALDMGGITENYWSGEAAVMAINAGVDLLLLPPNFESTFAFVVQAVNEGRISGERIDESVERLLQAKEELGLKDGPVFKCDRLESVLSHPTHIESAREIADAAMTLVKDDHRVFPLAAEKIRKTLVLSISDEDCTAARGEHLHKEIGNRIPEMTTAFIDPRSSDAELARILQQADSVDAVIAGIFVGWRIHKGSLSLPEHVTKVLRKLFNLKRPLAVISLGSPYILSQIPETPSYLCAYEASPLAVRAAVRAVFGETPITAKLPVSIPPHYQIGEGLTRTTRKMELEQDFLDDELQEVYKIIEKGIHEKVFPGAQLAVVKNSKLVSSRAFGRLTYESDSPVATVDTLYDIASVTKVVATTLTAMRLWEGKKILLDIAIKSYLPKFCGGEKDRVTLRHLLTHSAGLPKSLDFGKLTGDRNSVLEQMYEIPLQTSPGESVLYSDLGFLLIGRILETVTATDFGTLVQDTVIGPLKLKNTMFNPPVEWRNRIAPTEDDAVLNRGLVHGQVHDEKAYLLGGVAPHAGLFSTAEDLAALAQMLLNGGIYRHNRLLSPETVETWTTPHYLPKGSPWALGWHTKPDEESRVNSRFASATFGHTGFTGTSFWIDVEQQVAIVLLSNRVHPNRERQGIEEIRAKVHTAVFQALASGAFQ